MNNKPVAYNGSDNYLFVSYAHKDDSFVYPIIRELQKKYNVWYDEGIESGTKWINTITNKIKCCSFMLTFVSSNFFDSDFCQREILFAFQHGIKVINIRVNNAILPDDFSFLFGDEQMLNIVSSDLAERVVQDIVRKCRYFEKVLVKIEKNEKEEKLKNKQEIRYLGGKKRIVHGSQKLFSDLALPASGDHFSLINKKLKTEGGKEIILESYLRSEKTGCVYSINKDSRVVAKIFYEGVLKERVAEKIKLMSTIDSLENNPFIAWPIDSLFDDKGVFVGYTMPLISRNLDQCPNIKKLISKDSPYPSFIKEITKTQLLDMILSILYNIQALHNENIILCSVSLDKFSITSTDINHKMCSNIFMPNTEFVQIDSYPGRIFEDEPESITYFPPEFDEKDYKNYYRDFAWDNYGVFVIIYQLLFLKRSPYRSLNKNGGHLSLAKEGDFPYTLDENKTKENVPLEQAALWSHLPSYIKKVFIETADKNGKKHDQSVRTTVSEWIKYFETYKNDIASGRLAAIDDECNVAYPKKEIQYSKLDFEIKI